MTVMRVMLFVSDVIMLSDCEGNVNAGVVSVSAGYKYVDGTCGSGYASSTADVLGMSVVRGMRGVGGVCEMCMCCGNRGSVYVCLCLGSYSYSSILR